MGTIAKTNAAAPGRAAMNVRSMALRSRRAGATPAGCGSHRPTGSSGNALSSQGHRGVRLLRRSRSAQRMAAQSLREFPTCDKRRRPGVAGGALGRSGGLDQGSRNTVFVVGLRRAADQLRRSFSLRGRYPASYSVQVPTEDVVRRGCRPFGARAGANRAPARPATTATRSRPDGGARARRRLAATGADMALKDVAGAAELSERVELLVPLLRANALRTEHDGRVAPENIAALAQAGAFRMTAPRSFGGYQVPVK